MGCRVLDMTEQLTLSSFFSRPQVVRKCDFLQLIAPASCSLSPPHPIVLGGGCVFCTCLLSGPEVLSRWWGWLSRGRLGCAKRRGLGPERAGGWQACSASRRGADVPPVRSLLCEGSTLRISPACWIRTYREGIRSASVANRGPLFKASVYTPCFRCILQDFSHFWLYFRV